MSTDPETWRWVWLVAGLVLIGGEMLVPSTFVRLSLGISAALASLLAVAVRPVAHSSPDEGARP